MSRRCSTFTKAPFVGAYFLYEVTTAGMSRLRDYIILLSRSGLIVAGATVVKNFLCVCSGEGDLNNLPPR